MFVYRNKNNIVLFILGNIIGLTVIITTLIYLYLSTFLSNAHLTFSELKSIVSSAYSQKDQFENRHVTFLILGLDQRSDALESTLLTDTIILASLTTDNLPASPAGGQLTTISIPPHLWIHELKTKVNALYFYGEQRDNTTGPEFTMEELERIMGASIDYYVVMNYNDLDELVDLVGGIEVDVPQSFIDEKYRNPDYLSDQTKPIYQTVQFNKGLQNFDGKRALAYVRSRHSESEEGSDSSRSKRQAQVFQGIMKKLSNRSLITNPKQMGNIYRFWKESVSTDLSDHEALALGLNLTP